MRFYSQSGEQAEQHDNGERCNDGRQPPPTERIVHLGPVHPISLNSSRVGKNLWRSHVEQSRAPLLACLAATFIGGALTSTKDWQLGSVRARFGAHRRKTG